LCGSLANDHAVELWRYPLFGCSATEALGQILDLIVQSTCGRVIGVVLQQA
jgi:hypothetical protein